MKYYLVSEMAEMLGITTQALRQRIKKRGIKPEKKHDILGWDLFSEAQFEKIMEELKIGRPKFKKNKQGGRN